MLAYTFYEIDHRVRQYAETLVQRGDQVDFIGLGTPQQLADDVVAGVRLYRIQRRQNNEKGKLSYLIRLLRFLLNSMVFLSRKHCRNRYDLVHVHTVPDFLVFAAWFPKLTGAKIILDIHDVAPELYATKFKAPSASLTFKMLLRMEKLCAAFSHHVIAANEIWRQKLISRSVGDSKCTTILNYPIHMDPQGRRAREEDSRFIILYPGTLNHHQGVDIAIKAFALIKDKAPQAEFHIYGRGAEFENIAELITKLGLEERAFLKSFESREKILRIIEAADLGVDPKRTDGFANEALGGKIFEFMALGVPVIVSDTKVNRYYFNDSVVRFCRGGDVQDLARAILELCEDKEARRLLTKNAKEFVRGYELEVKKSVYFALVDLLTQPPRSFRPKRSSKRP